jgi:hypothetical protein
MSENTITLTADDATAVALVATIRAAVNGAGKYAAYVEAHDVTRENVKYHAAALAALAYPNERPVQTVEGKRTKYGNAVQAAGNGLRAALGKEKREVEQGVIRVSLSGEGGGTVTLREGDPQYAAALAFFGADGTVVDVVVNTDAPRQITAA